MTGEKLWNAKSKDDKLTFLKVFIDQEGRNENEGVALAYDSYVLTHYVRKILRL